MDLSDLTEAQKNIVMKLVANSNVTDFSSFANINDFINENKSDYDAVKNNPIDSVSDIVSKLQNNGIVILGRLFVLFL